MRCLVTGATGAVGPSVVDAFLDAGFELRTYSRNVPPPGLFAAPAEAFEGDIADQPRLTEAARGVDVIVHLASLMHIVNPPPELRTRAEIT